MVRPWPPRAIGWHVESEAASARAPCAHAWQVEDRLALDVLKMRQEKEASALPRFLPFGPWQKATPSLRDMHEWLNQENTAYAAKRLLEERKPIDAALLKSY